MNLHRKLNQGSVAPNLDNSFTRACIFHGPELKNDEQKFKKALGPYITEVNTDDSIKSSDFCGFVWPKINFPSATFNREVKVSGGQIKGVTYFQDVNFKKSVSF